MNGKAIQALRKALAEDVATFGARFKKSGRTIQGWECDRFAPDPFIVCALADLARTVKGR